MNLTRRVASVATLALVSAGLGVVAAAPASAAAPALDWQISAYFHEHIATHEVSGGATEDDATGVVTFPGGEGSFDAESGAGTITYDGTVAGSFVFLGVTQYEITIADPAVTVDGEGNGELSAVVSAFNIAGNGSPEDSTDPARVVVTTFDADGGWGDGMLSATPHWEGVLPPGEEAAALGISDGEPIDGKSFAPSFLGQLTSGTRPLFYASGSANDAKKAPATITAEAVGGKSVEADVSYGRGGVSFAVEASGGFSGTDEDGSGDGIYVGLAPSGGMPSVDNMEEDFDNFAAAAFVSKAAVQDGGFVASMTAQGQDLKRGTDYSIYTWRAHRHTSTSQDTETPVTINWSKVTLSLKTSWNAPKLVVTGSGKNGKPVGSVVAKLTKGGTTLALDPVRLKQGKATVSLARLPKGKWKAAVTYRGANYVVAKKTLTVTVR